MRSVGYALFPCIVTFIFFPVVSNKMTLSIKDFKFINFNDYASCEPISKVAVTFCDPVFQFQGRPEEVIKNKTCGTTQGAKRGRKRNSAILGSSLRTPASLRSNLSSVPDSMFEDLLSSTTRETLSKKRRKEALEPNSGTQTVARGRGKCNKTEFWTMAETSQKKWFERMVAGSFSRSDFVHYLTSTWDLLSKTCQAFTGLPVDVQEKVSKYAKNNMKLSELSFRRGYEKEAPSVVGFYCKVLGRFMKSETHMCEAGRAWVNSRQVMRELFEVSSSLSLLYMLKSSILDLQTKLVAASVDQTACFSNDMAINRVSYQNEQLTDLQSRLDSRIRAIVIRKQMGLDY